MTGPDADVLVVGAGPVGLVLAAELRAAGVSAVVVERSAGPDPRLRAPAITQRAIETVERHGLLPELLAGADPAARAAAAAPDGEPRTLPVRQERLERVLAAHVHRGGTPVLREHEAVRVATQPGTGIVGAEVRHHGRVRTLRARYVVGCDGGHSTVRRAAAIDFPGETARLTGYQAEVRVRGDLPAGWHRTPGGVVAYQPGDPPRVVSVEFTGPPADRERPVTLAEVEASVRRTSGRDVRLHDPRSLTRFTDNARLADRYRRGRLLLAGDAAHVHAPFGGQGLNLGIQDAVNLGWRLAAAVRVEAAASDRSRTGPAVATLLDGYERDRRPVAAAVLRLARAAVTLLDPAEPMTPAYELFEDLKRLDAVRRHLHERTAMLDVRYPAPVADPHPMLGRAPRGLVHDGGADDGRALSPPRPGRWTLLAAPEAAARLGPPDPAGLDVVVVPWREYPRLTPPDRSEPDAVLLRPDGFVAWLALPGGAEQPGPLADAVPEQPSPLGVVG